MTIIESVIECIDAENEKATKEMLRASAKFHQAEMNFWQGEMVALARCKAWLLTFVHEQAEKQNEE